METRKIDFTILGAGALGSILGAHLARSGQAVVMLARGPRAQEIERLGLRITGLAEFCQPVPVMTDVAHFEGADVFIVATKSYSTEAAVEPLRRAKIGAAFSIQKGLVKNEQLAAVWGRGRERSSASYCADHRRRRHSCQLRWRHRKASNGPSSPPGRH